MITSKVFLFVLIFCQSRCSHAQCGENILVTTPSIFYVRGGICNVVFTQSPPNKMKIQTDLLKTSAYASIIAFNGSSCLSPSYIESAFRTVNPISDSVNLLYSLPEGSSDTAYIQTRYYPITSSKTKSTFKTRTCGSEFEDEIGDFSNFGQDSSLCVWKIRAPSKRQITLEINYIEVYQGRIEMWIFEGDDCSAANSHYRLFLPGEPINNGTFVADSFVVLLRSTYSINAMEANFYTDRHNCNGRCGTVINVQETKRFDICGGICNLVFQQSTTDRLAIQISIQPTPEESSFVAFDGPSCLAPRYYVAESGEFRASGNSMNILQSVPNGDPNYRVVSYNYHSLPSQTTEPSAFETRTCGTNITDPSGGFSTKNQDNKLCVWKITGHSERTYVILDIKTIEVTQGKIELWIFEGEDCNTRDSYYRIYRQNESPNKDRFIAKSIVLVQRSTHQDNVLEAKLSSVSGAISGKPK